MHLHLITAEDPLTLDIRRRELIRFPQLTMPLLAALTPPHWTVTHTDELTHRVDCRRRYDLVGLTAATPGAPHAYELAAAFRPTACRSSWAARTPPSSPTRRPGTLTSLSPGRRKPCGRASCRTSSRRESGSKRTRAEAILRPSHRAFLPAKASIISPTPDPDVSEGPRPPSPRPGRHRLRSGGHISGRCLARPAAQLLYLRSGDSGPRRFGEGGMPVAVKRQRLPTVVGLDAGFTPDVIHALEEGVPGPGLPSTVEEDMVLAPELPVTPPQQVGDLWREGDVFHERLLGGAAGLVLAEDEQAVLPVDLVPGQRADLLGACRR